MTRHYLGIEIGGTKVQMAVGSDDGQLRGLWRGTVVVPAGAAGIRRQIEAAVPLVLQQAGVPRAELQGIGIGFGGPVDDLSGTVLTSHQIEGWNHFPLTEWARQVVGAAAVLGNDADVAGLGEAIHGAGQGRSPLFYVTLGSGIGGGLILNDTIYRGCGRGAAEIGHLRVHHGGAVLPLEQVSSGWGIARTPHSRLPQPHTAADVAELARQGDREALAILHASLEALAEALCHVIALLCPQRIVIGGGVSLMGDLLFGPLRRLVAERVFEPFRGLTDLVPAALGEEVVLHGAIALARRGRP